jgi:hypothetical protein
MAILSDFMHKAPARRSWREAAREWMRDTRHLLSMLTRPFERSLGEPKRELPQVREMAKCDRTELLRWATRFYDQSWDSVRGTQDKAQKLLGTIGVTVPLLIGLGVYARQSMAGEAGVASITSTVFAVVSVVLLLLAVLACLRCLAVTEFYTPYLLMVLDPEREEFRLNSAAWEARELLACAEYNTRRADWLTDFLRIGQRLFGVAIVFALLAGTFALVGGLGSSSFNARSLSAQPETDGRRSSVRRPDARSFPPPLETTVTPQN